MSEKECRKKRERLSLIVNTYCQAHDYCNGCVFNHENSWCYKLTKDGRNKVPLETLEKAIAEML